MGEARLCYFNVVKVCFGFLVGFCFGKFVLIIFVLIDLDEKFKCGLVHLISRFDLADLVG